jgi:hypothetical protein
MSSENDENKRIYPTQPVAIPLIYRLVIVIDEKILMALSIFPIFGFI